MNTDITNQNDSLNTVNTPKFIGLNGFFVIDSPCIFTNKKIVKVDECYDLILFLNDGGIALKNVQLRNAAVQNDFLTIVVHDTNSNRVHRYTQKFNDESACSWLLVEKNYFDEELQHLDY